MFVRREVKTFFLHFIRVYMCTNKSERTSATWLKMIFPNTQIEDRMWQINLKLVIVVDWWAWVGYYDVCCLFKKKLYPRCCCCTLQVSESIHIYMAIDDVLLDCCIGIKKKTTQRSQSEICSCSILTRNFGFSFNTRSCNGFSNILRVLF